MKKEPRYVKVKMHLTGDVRSVTTDEADELTVRKQASLYREVEKETATRRGGGAETAADGEKAEG